MFRSPEPGGRGRGGRRWPSREINTIEISRIQLQGAEEGAGFMDKVGQSVAIQGLEKGRPGLAKRLLEQTGVNQRTGVAAGVETFDQRRASFRLAHQLS